MVDKIVCAAKPDESYALYLPSGYTPARAWPILYVLDPRSRGTLAAERFRPGAENYGYILASSNNSLSDGPVEPNVEAMRAMWTDTHGRLQIDDHRVYAAGFSGTVRSCCTLARAVPGTIAGIIGAGAGFPFHEPPRKGDPFVFFGTVGDKDFNYYEMTDLEPRLEEAGIVHRIEIFDGVHQWPPEELATRALGWMEIQAMKAGTRAKDPAIVDELWKQTMARAREAEAAGNLFQAHRYYSGRRRRLRRPARRRRPRRGRPQGRRAGRQPRPPARLEGARGSGSSTTRNSSPALPASSPPSTPSGEPATVAQVVAALQDPRAARQGEERPRAGRAALRPAGAQHPRRADRLLPAAVVQPAPAVGPRRSSSSRSPSRSLPRTPSSGTAAPRPTPTRGIASGRSPTFQTSVDKGWKDLAALQQEEAFAPLRQDAEYQRILLALNENLKPPSGS